MVKSKESLPEEFDARIFTDFLKLIDTGHTYAKRVCLPAQIIHNFCAWSWKWGNVS
jgi:hypothetical protein